MYVCMYAHHTDIHAPHQKASVATQPSFRHHSFGRVLHKLWLALLPATQASQASLSLHCAELSHRHLLSTHNASEPFPFALPQGLGVIAQRHRRPFAHCPPSTQASQPSKPVPSPSTALSEPTGACFRRTPSPASRIAKGARRDCTMPRTAFRRPLPFTVLSSPTGACSRSRRTPSPSRRMAKGAWRDCATPQTALRALPALDASKPSEPCPSLR